MFASARTFAFHAIMWTLAFTGAGALGIFAILSALDLIAIRL